MAPEGTRETEELNSKPVSLGKKLENEGRTAYLSALRVFKTMNKSIFAILIVLFVATFISANDLDHQVAAKKAFEAHGGEKLKSMRSLVVRGSAEISGSPQVTFPATFSTIFSGDKYLLEITNPFQPLRQVSDGNSTQSSLPGFSLPPVTRLGLPMLQRIGDEGFKVEPLPEKFKKRPGFRVVSPEGFYTDFLVDAKTGAIKSYESAFEIDGRLVSTSVEVDRVRDVDGVKIPERYSQRLELGQFTVYVTFRATEILVNSEMDTSIFNVR